MINPKSQTSALLWMNHSSSSYTHIVCVNPPAAFEYTFIKANHSWSKDKRIKYCINEIYMLPRYPRDLTIFIDYVFKKKKWKDNNSELRISFCEFQFGVNFKGRLWISFLALRVLSKWIGLFFFIGTLFLYGDLTNLSVWKIFDGFDA